MSHDEILDSYRPRYVAQLRFGAAAGGSAAGYKKLYVLSERLAAGTLAANEVGTTMINDGDDADTQFGAGSFGAWECRQVLRGGALGAELYGIAVAEPAGVAAAAVFTFVGNAAANGVWTVNIGGTVFAFTVEAADTPAQAGDKLVAAFDALHADTKPPCALVRAALTPFAVTATMANKGLKGNTAPSYVITTGSEPGTQTLAATAPTFLGGTLDPALATVLATMATTLTPAILATWDTTPDGSTLPLDLLRDHAIAKGAAEVGQRCVVFTCLCKTSATLLTDIAALDDDDAKRMRVGMISLNPATNSPGTWHASAAAYMARRWCKAKDLAYPFNNVPLPYMVAPPDTGDILSNAEVDVLLNAGGCVLNYNMDRGRYLLVKGIGARLFATKPQSWAIVDVTDWLRLNALVNWTAAFPAGTKLAEDGEDNLDENTTTPAGVLDILRATIFGANMRGLLRNREALWASSSAAISATVEGRVNVLGDHAVMMGLDIIAAELRQHSGYIGAGE